MPYTDQITVFFVIYMGAPITELPSDVVSW